VKCTDTRGGLIASDRAIISTSTVGLPGGTRKPMRTGEYDFQLMPMAYGLPLWHRATSNLQPFHLNCGRATVNAAGVLAVFLIGFTWCAENLPYTPWKVRTGPLEPWLSSRRRCKVHEQTRALA
jgi:hypothetical protein